MELFRLERNVLPDKMIRVSPNVNSSDRLVDQIVGSIVGLAVGDALGARGEFRPRDYFIAHPIKEMEGGGTWGLNTGQWTDDTSMGLCLASSLISKGCYDPYDQMVRYKWWYKYGYLSSTGQCFDIGNATRDSLEEFIQRQQSLCRIFNCNQSEVDCLPWDEIRSKTEFQIDCSQSGVAGNGALMRLAPIPLFFYRYPQLAVEYAGRSARLTHGDEKAVDACRYYAALILAALQGEPKEQILSKDFYKLHFKWFGPQPLQSEVLNVAQGSFKRKNGYDDGIRGKGYIVSALEAALWAFWSDDDSFKKGALNAVNLGDDTDTTAAIYGQLAGAFYGFHAIHKDWIKKVYALDLLKNIGQWIFFKGSRYNITPEDNQIISINRSFTTISSTQNKTNSNENSSTHSNDIRHATTNQLTDREAKALQAHQRQLASNPTLEQDPYQTQFQRTRRDNDYTLIPNQQIQSMHFTNDNYTRKTNPSNQTESRQYQSQQDTFHSPSYGSNYSSEQYPTDFQYPSRRQDRDSYLTTMSTRHHPSGYLTNSDQLTQQHQSSARLLTNSSYNHQTQPRTSYSSAYNNNSNLHRGTYSPSHTLSPTPLASTNQFIGGSNRYSLPPTRTNTDPYSYHNTAPKRGQYK